MNRRTLVAGGVITVLLVGFGLYTVDAGGDVSDFGSWSIQVHNISFLSNHSDAVVSGTVQEIGEARWPTADGSRPATVTDDAIASIYRPVTVDIERVLAGEASGTVTVRVAGGTVDGHTYTDFDAPEFTRGEHVLLFLRRQGNHYVTTSARYGKMVISDDGLVHRDVPDESEDDPGFQETINVSRLAADIRR